MPVKTGFGFVLGCLRFRELDRGHIAGILRRDLTGDILFFQYVAKQLQGQAILAVS